MRAQSCAALCDPWTVARQAPLSVGFSRKEYWSGLPFPPPRDLPDPRMALTSPALAGGFFATESPGVKTARGALQQERARSFWEEPDGKHFRVSALTASAAVARKQQRQRVKNRHTDPEDR